MDAVQVDERQSSQGAATRRCSSLMLPRMGAGHSVMTRLVQRAHGRGRRPPIAHRLVLLLLLSLTILRGS